jgi:hypothetical protein
VLAGVGVEVATVLVTVAAAVDGGVAVALGIGGRVAVAEAVGVLVGWTAGVLVCVADGVLLAAVAVAVGVGVVVEVGVWVVVAVTVGVWVGVAVTVGVGVGSTTVIGAAANAGSSVKPGVATMPPAFRVYVPGTVGTVTPKARSTLPLAGTVNGPVHRKACPVTDGSLIVAPLVEPGVYAKLSAS